jgi:hypothetical protein
MGYFKNCDWTLKSAWLQRHYFFIILQHMRTWADVNETRGIQNAYLD